MMLIAFAGSAQTITDKADEAYSAENYTEAIKLYNQALDSLGSSSMLFYNLGNAYYRADSLAQAILAYERALLLDPTNSDARANLDFVNTKIIDTPVDTSSYSTIILDKALQLMSPNAWGWTALVCFIAVLVLAGGYILSNGVGRRKACFFGGLAMLFIFIGALSITLIGTNRSTSHNNAIITAQSTQLSTTPSQPLTSKQQAFLLHEGCRVEIVDSIATPLDPSARMWYEVKVDSEHRAWVNANDIERI